MPQSAQIIESDPKRLPAIPKGTIRLLINETPLIITGRDSNLPAGVLNCSVQTKDGKSSLWNAEPLGGQANNLEIFVKKANGSFHRLELANKFSSKIISSLKNGLPEDCNECISFGLYLNGMPHRHNGVFRIDDWDKRQVTNIQQLTAGQSVLLLKFEGEIEDPKHMALYLGSSLFLSKWGHQGGLAVSSMEAMLDEFGGDAVISLTPKVATSLVVTNPALSGANFQGGSEIVSQREDLTVRGLSRSPADMPPDYDLPEYAWAWRDRSLGEYQDLMAQFRVVLDRFNKIPAIAQHDFSAQHWTQIVSCLFNSFEVTGNRPVTLRDFEAIDRQNGTRTNPLKMLEAGIFSAELGAKTNQFVKLEDLNSLFKLDPTRVRFSASAYSNDTIWSPPLRDILGRDENFLLLLNPKGNNISVQLIPTTPEALLDRRLFNFYVRLADAKIPSQIQVHGPASLKDSLLGRYDLKRVREKSVLIFPQYDQIEEEKEKATIKTDKWRIESRSTSLNRSLVQLGGMNGTVTIAKDADFGYAIQVGNNRPYTLYTAKFAEFAEMVLDPNRSSINTVVESEEYLFIKPKEGPLAREGRSPEEVWLVEVASKYPVMTEAGQVDEAATKKYKKLILDLSTGGAVSFDRMSKLYSKIKATEGGVLSQDQEEAIEKAFGCYTVSAIRRGQIGDLSGLSKVLPILKNCGLGMAPGEADRLRMYVDCLTPGSMMSILSCITVNQGDFVDPRVRSLVAKQEQTEEARLIRRREVLSEYDHFQLPYFQEQLIPKLIEHVQALIPGMKVDFQTLKEIHKFSQVLCVMLGLNGNLDDAKADVAIPLVALLEHTVGRKLPELRKGLSRTVREELEKIDEQRKTAELPSLN